MTTGSPSSTANCFVAVSKWWKQFTVLLFSWLHCGGCFMWMDVNLDFVKSIVTASINCRWVLLSTVSNPDCCVLFKMKGFKATLHTLFHLLVDEFTKQKDIKLILFVCLLDQIRQSVPGCRRWAQMQRASHSYRVSLRATHHLTKTECFKENKVISNQGEAGRYSRNMQSGKYPGRPLKQSSFHWYSSKRRINPSVLFLTHGVSERTSSKLINLQNLWCFL